MLIFIINKQWKTTPNINRSIGGITTDGHPNQYHSIGIDAFLTPYKTINPQLRCSYI